MSSPGQGGGSGAGRERPGLVYTGLAILALLGVGSVAWGLRDLLTGALSGAVKLFWGGLAVLASGAALATMGAVQSDQRVDPARREQEPDRPWLWRRDWAQGRVECGSRTLLWMLWTAALLWNAFLWMLWPFLGPLREAMAGGDKLSYLFLIFPLVGLLLLVFAIFETVRQSRFGISVLELETLPGVIGGELRGRVFTRLQKRPEGPFFVVLTCTHHWQTEHRERSGRGRTHTTTRFESKVLWRDEHEVPPEALGIGPRGLLVPVRFRIPIGHKATKDEKKTQIMWRLNLVAEMPGPDFDHHFDVPVFVTEESRDETEEERRDRLDAAVVPEDRGAAEALVRRIPGGGTEFLLPVKFTVKDRVGGTIVTFLCVAATVAAHRFGLPLPMVLVVGSLALLMAVATLATFGYASTLTVVGGEILLIQRFFGIPSTKRFRASEVQQLEVGRLMKQAGAAQPKSWLIEIVLHNGKRQEIGALLEDRDQAEWLAAEIERLLLGQGGD